MPTADGSAMTDETTKPAPANGGGARLLVVDDEADWVRLRDPERERPGLSFQLEPGDTPPAWPARDGGVQMQAHLDLLVDDLDTGTTRAEKLGATVEAHQPAPGVRVLRDPFGHVFCLFLEGS